MSERARRSSTSPGVDPAVMRIARAVAREAMGAGAVGVVLVGSHVRGDAHAHSDIDLIAVVPKAISNDGRPRALRPYRIRNGRLVSLSWETRASVRESFREPQRLTTFVPGWREAIILTDPHGHAAKVKSEAERWTWEPVADVCDRYVAKNITGLAEEVHKLAGMLAEGNVHAAAAQRSILAVWLAGIMAVHHRILFGTDNVLWELVGERMGVRWRRAQSVALSEHGETLEVSCRAALTLYALAAAGVRPVLSREQRGVVDAACAVRL